MNLNDEKTKPENHHLCGEEVADHLPQSVRILICYLTVLNYFLHFYSILINILVIIICGMDQQHKSYHKCV